MSATRAWLFLVALSAGSTAIAASGLAGAGVALAILALSWAKAQIILNRYLGLAAAPAWGRGFAIAMAAYMALLMVLAVAAG